MYEAVTSKKSADRLSAIYDKNQKIRLFGNDNAYPQNIEKALQFSATGSGCVEIYQDFIQGEGFLNDALNDMEINRDEETWYDVLEYAAYDMAHHRGFAIHVNWNLLGEIVEVRRLKFKHCRLGKADDKEYVGKVAYSTKWGTGKVKDEDVKWIHKFNPRPNVLLAQIEEAGGIDKYNGQVLYWTPETDVYPLSPFDSVLEDLDTDAQLKVTKNNNVKNNFLAFYIFKNFTDFDETTDEGRRVKAKIEEEVHKFQGPTSKK